MTTRLVAGLLILKHMHNLSDEALCDRWVENWRTRIFSISAGKWCSHVAPLDRSSLTRWRQRRLGKQPIAALLQESLSVAHRASRGGTDRYRGSTQGAIEKLVALTRREGVELHQSYLRVAKRAAILVGRYTEAYLFKRKRVGDPT